MGRTLAHDVALAESWGYSRRDAIRVVARLALIRAEEGVSHPADYLRELYQMMVATAAPDAVAERSDGEQVTERRDGADQDLGAEPAASDQRLVLL